jgi:tetratricopeptide (TPR) repeat protein
MLTEGQNLNFAIPAHQIAELLARTLGGSIDRGYSPKRLQTRVQFQKEMREGIQSYRATRYADAVKHFSEAIRLDGSRENAHLYLATSYMIQWVPGDEAIDNRNSYTRAKEEYEQVLKVDPENELALASLASMAYNSAAFGTPQQKAVALEEAKRLNERRIEVSPQNPEPYYYLGVIDWAEAFTPIQTARVEEHMRPEDPGPLKDSKAKGQLKVKYGPIIDDGLENLKKCLARDKENEDAMSYMNLLLRKKADLEDSPTASKADAAKAEYWSNESASTKQIKSRRSGKAE